MKIIFQDDNGKVLREEIFTLAECVAMDTDMIDRIEWIVNAARNKARQRVDDIVTKSGLGSKFTAVDAKHAIIDTLIQQKSVLIMSASER